MKKSIRILFVVLLYVMQFREVVINANDDNDRNEIFVEAQHDTDNINPSTKVDDDYIPDFIKAKVENTFHYHSYETKSNISDRLYNRTGSSDADIKYAENIDKTNTVNSENIPSSNDHHNDGRKENNKAGSKRRRDNSKYEHNVADNHNNDESKHDDTSNTHKNESNNNNNNNDSNNSRFKSTATNDRLDIDLEEEIRLKHAEALRLRKIREREIEGEKAVKRTIQAGSTEQCDWKVEPLAFIKGRM